MNKSGGFPKSPLISRGIKVSARGIDQHRRVLHAYHEAGHSVVWHVVGGLVEEVSIASSQAGYRGYCRFGFLIHVQEKHNHSTLDEHDKQWPDTLMRQVSESAGLTGVDDTQRCSQ